MSKQDNKMELTKTKRLKYRRLLQQAYSAAQLYDGSERANDNLSKPLGLIDKFILANANGQDSLELEKEFARAVLPKDWPEGWPVTVDDFLGEVSQFYKRIEKEDDYENVLSTLERGKGLVLRSKTSFVQTDDGQIEIANGNNSKSFEVRTQPRLSMLIKHLKGEGIYTDDLIVHVGTVSSEIVRAHPYVLVQIPRLDKEIAVCDQIGEITFVADEIKGSDFWGNMSKDKLKAKEGVSTVTFNDEDQWWLEIQGVLAGKGVGKKKKINLNSYSRKKEPFDRELIKRCILAHFEAMGEWVTVRSGQVEYGPYVGQEVWRNINYSLRQGSRGLDGGESLTALKAEVSKENDFDYSNHLNKEPLGRELIKRCILAHFEATGKWPTRNSDQIEYGPYAGQEAWQGVWHALHFGVRGLDGGDSFVILKAEVAEENNLNYSNNLSKGSLDKGLIKRCILAHFEATGKWPTQYSDQIEYGPYAGQEVWKNIDSALYQGLRGLDGEQSFSTLKAEVAEENNLNYSNNLGKDLLDKELIKQCILAHFNETSKWPAQNSGDVKYGPYSEQETWGNINNALHYKQRGLDRKESLATLKREVAEENGFDCKNLLDRELIKQCIFAHLEATGGWPVGRSGQLKYGPYAGQEAWKNINSALRLGFRGLEGKETLATLKAEVAEENDIAYKPHVNVSEAYYSPSQG